ncbi:MAG: zinc ribbon domain-containing protein [Vagococcus sp.]|uniref:zinc ribbon domain-containing protein n=1 Tax=Vagococcus sp. TaxID=1933889 RepID=UPI002FC9EF41
MKFCSECGAELNGANFCPNCGSKTSESTNLDDSKTTLNHDEVLWEGKQSILFGLNDKLRYKATDSIELKMKEDRYKITNYVVRITHDSTTSTNEEVINFEDIKDVKIIQGLKEKVQGIGNLEILTLKGNTFLMKGIKQPEIPKDIIMKKALDFQRSRNILYKREL